MKENEQWQLLKKRRAACKQGGMHQPKESPAMPLPSTFGSSTSLVVVGFGRRSSTSSNNKYEALSNFEDNSGENQETTKEEGNVPHAWAKITTNCPQVQNPPSPHVGEDVNVHSIVSHMIGILVIF
jgi:hypothetical protein